MNKPNPKLTKVNTASNATSNTGGSTVGAGGNKKLLAHKVQTLTLQRFGRAFTAVLLLVAFGLMVIEVTRDRYGEVAIESLFLFPAIFGFTSFVFIVIIAKLLRRLLMRDEDYYDKERYFTGKTNTKPNTKPKPKGGGA